MEGKSVIAAKRPGTVGVLVSSDEGGCGRRGVVTPGDQVVADQVLVGVEAFEYGPPTVDDFLRGEQFRFAVVEGDLVAEDVGECVPIVVVGGPEQGVKGCDDVESRVHEAILRACFGSGRRWCAGRGSPALVGRKSPVASPRSSAVSWGRAGGRKIVELRRGLRHRGSGSCGPEW